MFNQNKIPPLPYLFPSLPSTAPMSAPSHPHTFSLSHIDGLISLIIVSYICINILLQPAEPI